MPKCFADLRKTVKLCVLFLGMFGPLLGGLLAFFFAWASVLNHSVVRSNICLWHNAQFLGTSGNYVDFLLHWIVFIGALYMVWSHAQDALYAKWREVHIHKTLSLKELIKEQNKK